eukprot:6214151-Pleurochrysis_carterae.AAC.6
MSRKWVPLARTHDRASAQMRTLGQRRAAGRRGTAGASTSGYSRFCSRLLSCTCCARGHARIKPEPRTRTPSCTAPHTSTSSCTPQATPHRTRMPSRPAHACPLGVRPMRRPNYAQHAQAPQGVERA